MTNYITRLENELREKTVELDALQRELNEFRAYLATDKFAVDPTIQVQDVENRLMAARHAASEAATNDANLRTWKGKCYSQEQLERAFDKVLDSNQGGADRDDWKGSIRATIASKDFDVTEAAIVHFTATEINVISADHDACTVEISALGYRAGPAGP